MYLTSGDTSRYCKQYRIVSHQNRENRSQLRYYVQHYITEDGGLLVSEGAVR